MLLSTLSARGRRRRKKAERRGLCGLRDVTAAALIALLLRLRHPTIDMMSSLGRRRRLALSLSFHRVNRRSRRRRLHRGRYRLQAANSEMGKKIANLIRIGKWSRQILAEKGQQIAARNILLLLLTFVSGPILLLSKIFTPGWRSNCQNCVNQRLVLSSASPVPPSESRPCWQAWQQHSFPFPPQTLWCGIEIIIYPGWNLAHLGLRWPPLAQFRWHPHIKIWIGHSSADDITSVCRKRAASNYLSS